MNRNAPPRRHRPLAAALIATLATLSLGACRHAPELYRQQGSAFGARVELTIAGVPDATARRAAAAVLTELGRLQHAQQPQEAGAPLAAVNAALAAGRPARVGPEVAELVTLSQDYAHRADELFNPAAGPWPQQWRPQAEESAPPRERGARPVAARPRMSELTLSGERLSSANPDVQLDFDGIAKGWALDHARERLQQAGVASALVTIGDNALALGHKPDGSPWKITLAAPRGGSAMARLALDDGEAIGTRREIPGHAGLAGQRHCPYGDPRDGDCAMRAAILIAPPGAHAGALSDAASQALYFAGPQGALGYARRFGVRDALLVDGHGAVWVTESLAPRLEWQDPKPSVIHTLTP